MTVSRFSQVSRRAFLGGASMAALTGLAACANSSSNQTSTPAASQTPAATAEASATATEMSSATAAATTAAANGSSLPAPAKATVSFTYTSEGGMAKNPYYAVWVEDANGTFVKTLLLCHLNGQDRWLNEMSAWYQASGGTDTTTEGTKPAGSYDCTWDGTDATGAKVKAGTYNICIEANREHGQESMVSKKVVLGSAALTEDLGTNGELTASSLKYTV